MCKIPPDELNKMDHKTGRCHLPDAGQLDRLEHNYENLVEYHRFGKSARFGRHTEKLDDIAGQLSFLMRQKRIMMEQPRGTDCGRGH